MKKKISKILGVGLTIVLLTSLLVVAAPVSAGTLSWGAETIMDSTSTYQNTLKSGINIIDVAANGDTVFAATSSTSAPLYKSTDGGVIWSGLENSSVDVGELTLGTLGTSVKAVAVASDDADVVVLVLSSNNVTYSTDGGASWDDLGIPGGTAVINSIDVSSGTPRSLAAGGSIGGGPELYTRILTFTGAWEPKYAGGGAAPSQTAIRAVKYSPNYPTDRAIAVITDNTSGVDSTFQLFRAETGDEQWNRSIDYLADADTEWANGIVLTPATPLSAIAGGLGAADIALPATFLANDEGERLAFLAVAGATSGSEGGGVIRLTDIVQKDFQTWSGGDTGAIGSLAYNDAGKLMAGSYTTFL